MASGPSGTSSSAASSICVRATLPRHSGGSYWHVAYRLYARFTPSAPAPPVEGLYFLRSDCDSALMARAGNIVTDFNFHVAGVSVNENAEVVRIAVDVPHAMGSATLSKSIPPELPAASAFDTLEEAAAFLKYKPFGVSVDQRVGVANVVRIVRDESAWQSRLLHIGSQDWQFLSGQDVHPEICYQVEPIAYQWNRGRMYRM